MSKIPAPQSRIPSLTKHSAPQEQTKAPPKSKIPSLGKGDKKGPKPKETEAPKRSQIPPPGSISKEKSTSKIPAPGRPDSAKENKDPTLNHNDSIEETQKSGKPDAKPASRIPSVSKPGSKSKIPSLPRQDSHGKSSVSSNEHHSDENLESEEPMVNGNGKPAPAVAKSRIPSLSSPHQTSGIPTTVTKIPSFSRANGPPKQEKPVDKVDSTPPPSKIPHLGSTGSTPVSSTQAAAPKSGIPTMSPSAISEEPGAVPYSVTKSKIPSLPSPYQTSGIPVAPTPDNKTETHEHKASNHNDSKIPSIGGAPKSKIPSASGSKSPRIPSEEKHMENKDPEIKESETTEDTPTHKTETPSTAARVAPPPPPRKDVEKQEAPDSQSPMEKYIFSEAKKMEKLLRNEDIVVEVPASELVDDTKTVDDANAKTVDDAKAKTVDDAKTVNDAKTEDEIRQAEICRFEKAQEAEDLISEVLKSYAPDLPKYSSDRSLDLLSNEGTPEKKKLTPAKTPTTEKTEDGNKTVKEKPKEEVCFQTFGKRSTPLVEKAPKEEAKAHMFAKPDTKDISLNLSAITAKKIAEEAASKKEEVVPVKSPPVSSPETPAIDTLGQYEQQARRSRSRQRKVITPDTEEPERTFDEETTKDQAKTDIDKDKFGKSPFETETSKDAKPAAKPTKAKSKYEKPKFVIESSLGKDFYASRKPDDTSSKENIHDDLPMPELIVIPNKTFIEETNPAPPAEPEQKPAAFEEVELSSHKESKQDMRAWSMDELDEKTVKCGCGRGGKCTIM